MKNYTETELAKIIIATLRENGVEPTANFTADSGEDYGYVSAYELAGGKGYAIAYGDSGETNYAVADDTDDLGDWLISQDLSGLDLLRNRASVFGVETVDAAPQDSTNLCAVLISRNYYGPHSEISVAMEDNGQREAEFDNAAAAQAWIDGAEEDYVLSHNESSRPTYKVVEL
jgi:hypothetical protein